MTVAARVHRGDGCGAGASGSRLRRGCIRVTEPAAAHGQQQRRRHTLLPETKIGSLRPETKIRFGEPRPAEGLCGFPATRGGPPRVMPVRAALLAVRYRSALGSPICGRSEPGAAGDSAVIHRMWISVWNKLQLCKPLTTGSSRGDAGAPERAHAGPSQLPPRRMGGKHYGTLGDEAACVRLNESIFVIGQRQRVESTTPPMMKPKPTTKFQFPTERITGRLPPVT